MSRFESLSYSIDEARRFLRDRFGRLLRSHYEAETWEWRDGFDLSDVDALELLRQVRISHGDDAATVRSTYEKYRSKHPNVPTFDELLDNGWFGVTWGRITTEICARDAARQQREPLRYGLDLVLNPRNRSETAFAFDDISLLPQGARLVAARLMEEPAPGRCLVVPSPEWVAARLWEQRPTDDDRAALRWWVDRCQLVGQPVGAPMRWWARADARAWRQAAFDILRTDSELVDWEREKILIDAQRRIEWEDADAERRIEWEHVRTPVMPSGLIQRWGWVNGPHHRHGWGRALELCGDTWVLLDMFCEDLLAVDRAPDGPSVAELLDLIVTRPSLLVLLATRIQQKPGLLADVLLHPATSAWGCLLVADWMPHLIGAWARSLQEGDAREGRERAFADAMAIATQHLRGGGGSATEMAELLTWLHDKVRVQLHAMPGQQRQVTEPMLNAAHGELQSLPIPQLKEILEALSFRERDGLGTPRFTAALDLAAVTGLTDALDGDKAVSAYVARVRAEEGFFSSIGLTPAQASVLALAAKRSFRWKEFLSPIDVATELRKAKSDEAYEVKDNIARALRAHIRVLSRAIVGWEGGVPDELIEALVSAIRSGSTFHEEKGRVGAFAARYETGFEASRAEPPLIVDVAKAYKRLPEAIRRDLDNVILLIDEPLSLALFLERAPVTIRDRIAERLEALTPDDAAEVHSLSEVQGRIEALLNVGAIGAASKHISFERELETLGRVEGRAITRLRWELRLALHRRDFERISQMLVPQGLKLWEVTAARDAIDFYKAIAELSKPNGNAAIAEAIFGSLARRHPRNAAYVVNRFAARLSQILGRNLFKTLDPAEISAAREAMNEVDRALRAALDVDSEDARIHGANKALLLLAIGRNEEAYQMLQRIRMGSDSDSFDAYLAVALARMGREDEANAVLAASEEKYPQSEVLKAAYEHVRHDEPANLGVVALTTDDPVGAIQPALFLLTQLDPGMQARVVGRETTENLLAGVIRSAAAGVTSLVPHFLDANLQEDDITAVLHRILEARVSIFGWSVHDQSKGGYSARGNPGERDLVIKKKDGRVLSVIEAVVCNQNPKTETQRRNLTSHFQKLFGYEQCRVFFHVVYSYVNNPKAVVEVMKAIARADAPDTFAYVRTENLPQEDSGPRGFVASYASQDGCDVKVICLVLDMLQYAQRDAANLAGRTRKGGNASAPN